jgi:hypothetical protein
MLRMVTECNLDFEALPGPTGKAREIWADVPDEALCLGRRLDG